MVPTRVLVVFFKGIVALVGRNSGFEASPVFVLPTQVVWLGFAALLLAA